MTGQERIGIIEAEFRAVGWNPAETPTLDDSGNLTDGSYWEPCATVEPELRAQCRMWIESFQD